MKQNIAEILGKYTAGEANTEETNAALQAAGSAIRLHPGKNLLTAAEIAATHAETAEAANGYGLLDTGTGSLDKVRVVDGRLDGGAINEVQPDGSTNMPAYVHIGGRKYAVRGDALAE